MAYYLSASSGAYAELGFDLPDNALTAIQFADPEEVGWRGQDPNREKLGMGFRVRPETVPSTIRIRSDTYPLPDVLAHFVVSSRFRALVERFEPDVHQFIPVEVYLAGQDKSADTYYWFNILARQDSVNRECTTYKWQLDWTKQQGFWSSVGLSDPRLVLDAGKIKEHHIWTDPYLISFKNGFCSNEFGAAALSEHISGLALARHDEI